MVDIAILIGVLVQKRRGLRHLTGDVQVLVVHDEHHSVIADLHRGGKGIGVQGGDDTVVGAGDIHVATPAKYLVK